MGYSCYSCTCITIITELLAESSLSHWDRQFLKSPSSETKFRENIWHNPLRSACCCSMHVNARAACKTVGTSKRDISEILRNSPMIVKLKVVAV